MSKGPADPETMSDPDGDGNPRALPFCLEAVAGLDRTWKQPSVFVLRGDVLRVGRQRPGEAPDRAPVNDIVMAPRAVSRHHASFVYESRLWHCRDEGSSSGTFVNDTCLAKGRLEPIFVGDRISLGERGVVFVCRSQEEGLALVARELPSPLARLHERLSGSADRSKRAATLFHDLDRALRFMVAGTLAWLRRAAQQQQQLRQPQRRHATLLAELAAALRPEELQVARADRDPATGAWLRLFRRLANLVPSAPGLPPIARAARRAIEELGHLDEAIELRSLWAPDPAPTPCARELAEAEADLRKLATRLLVAFAPLSGSPLVSVARAEVLVDGYRYDVHVQRGPDFAQLEPLECRARMLHRWGYLLDFAADPATERPLLLAPLVAGEEGRTGWTPHFASRLDLGPRGRQVELRSAGRSDEAIRMPIPWYPEFESLFDYFASAPVRHES